MGNKKNKKKNSTKQEKNKQYKVKPTKVKKEKVEKTENKKENKKEKKAKKKHPKLKKAILITILILFLLGLIAVGVAVGIVFNIIKNDTGISEEDLNVKYENTVMLDLQGNIIANLNDTENRKTISKDEMSPYLEKAFVAIEDERFEEHQGVDIKRTIGATVEFVLKGGESSYGGSTITQQLVKNLTEERASTGLGGIERKIKEMSRAYQIENLISKSQILELYLNLIPLGGWGKNICGVEMGAKYYFDKTAKDLDLAESAFLAGINHAPNYYDPFDKTGEGIDNTEDIKKRTKTVLNKMLELQKINQEEYDVAVAKVDAGLPFKEGKVSTNAELSYFTQAVVNQIITQMQQESELSYEAAKSKLYGSGYVIYTTQDTPKQKIMEEEFKDEYYVKASREREGEHTQAGMTLIDNATGYVVAICGGLGSDADPLGTNFAKAPKQPGSCAKPVAVILPGLYYKSITAATVFDDTNSYFGRNSVRNNVTKQLGLDNVIHGIGNSSNVLMAKAASVIGYSRINEFLRTKLHISTITDQDSGYPIALGGWTNGVSTLEMAAAYATIANDGMYKTPTFYIKMEDGNGNIVLEPSRIEERVYSEQIAYVAKQILKEPVNGDITTASYAKVKGMDTCAKTGTSSDDYDRWFCGFTSYYTAATWFGFEYNETVRGYSKNPAGSLWSNIMDDVHVGLANSTFKRPSGVTWATVCLDSGLVAGENCTRKDTVPFVSGTVPSGCKANTKLTICKETGKIATEYCKEVEEKMYLAKPKTEEKPNWTTDYKEKFIEAPKETCPTHTKPEDKTKPVIKIKGDLIVTVKLNGTYKEEGATASDDTDGDLTKNIKTEGTVNTKKVGTYTITYKVTDAAGNEATAKRTVKVVKNNETTNNTTNTTTNTTNTTNTTVNNTVNNTTNNVANNTTNTNTIKNNTTNNTSNSTTNTNKNNTENNSSR